MIYGYARCSTDLQDTSLQTSALFAAGCQKVFEEKASGGRWDRPKLQELVERLQPGDVVVVWKLDRLSRSLKDLLHILDKLDSVGAGFRSVTESVDTTAAAGRMLMNIIGSFSQYEREILKERTVAGLAEARKRGVIGGRPKKLNKKQVEVAAELVKSGKSNAEVARLFTVHPSTIGRELARLPGL